MSGGTAPEPSLPDKIEIVHQRLREAGLPHAFGGALALAYYAEPRATIDVDLNVFVAPDGYAQVNEALTPVGITGTVDVKNLARDGQCRLWWGRTPLDLFFAYDPLHEAMRRAARMVPFGEITLPILAPEHLMVCKAVFDRPKDWIDIEQMLIGVDALDVSEVGAWMARIVGADDKRALRLGALVDEALGL